MSTIRYSRPVAAKILHYFNGFGDYNKLCTFYEDTGSIRASAMLQNKIKNLLCNFEVLPDGYTLYVEFPFLARYFDNRQMDNVSTYINYVNCRIFRGNYEIDPNNGMIRFKMFILCDENSATDDMIGESLDLCYNMIAKYEPGFLDIFLEDKSAMECIEEIKSRNPVSASDEQHEQDSETSEEDEDEEAADNSEPIVRDPFSKEDAVKNDTDNDDDADDYYVDPLDYEDDDGEEDDDDDGDDDTKNDEDDNEDHDSLDLNIKVNADPFGSRKAKNQ